MDLLSDAVIISRCDSLFEAAYTALYQKTKRMARRSLLPAQWKESVKLRYSQFEAIAAAESNRDLHKEICQDEAAQYPRRKTRQG